MSATREDALHEFPGPSFRIEAPAPDSPDPTQDLADETTSELGAKTRLAPLPPPLAAANVLRDRYVLETPIGTGGTAVVYRAVDLRRDATSADGRRVAIKLLRPELRDRPAAIGRLQREFRQTQAAAHPGVVRFFDLDCDRGAWFIVMELLAGEPLGASLRRSAPAGLAAAEALRIACAAGDALAHAHAQGIAHGDVKPDNIFLTASGELRLLDFGVAPEPPERQSPGSAPVVAAATRVYASAEVLAGAAPEPRDDVFSLACVTYEMLAGAHPYGRRGADAAARAGTVPPAPEALDPTRRTALMAALSLERAGRPAMAEFVQALRDELPAPASPAAAVFTAEPTAAPIAAEAPPPAARARRRPALSTLASVAAALALVLGILIGRLQGEGGAPAPPPLTLVEREAPPPAAAADAADAPAEAPPEPASTPAPDAAVAPAPATPGLVYFDAPQMIVSKRAVVAAIPMRHLSRAARAVSVHWRAVDGSARAGRDYGGPDGGVETFVEGNSFRILYVPILQDRGARRDRSFSVEMTSATPGAELGPTPRVEITILGES